MDIVLDPLRWEALAAGDQACVQQWLVSDNEHVVAGQLLAQLGEARLGVAGEALRLGAADLDGRVQVLDGLEGGERVVVYSHKPLKAGSRIDVVERIAGATELQDFCIQGFDAALRELAGTSAIQRRRVS